jgi:hypothetical protein
VPGDIRLRNRADKPKIRTKRGNCRFLDTARPTINGAALIVANPTTLESATYDLPATDGGAEFWTKNKAGTVYKYKNRLAPEGPSDVKIAKLKNGFIKVVAKGLQGFSLDEPSQGSIATTIAVGSIRYCSLFETVKKDVGISGTKAGTFKSKDQPAPAQCDDGSPSGAFLDGCRPL